ncbi:uncharacterized protein At5g65660 isoform X2 [Phoenix dactylifera]|uniref:Uncharacterized protein At5g65660 isoform X2 n=1 Tax=Phoenix dactylifera TaxID=42345 RepID=A0A8B7BTU5_PHODC|nr:uncharacterized protein At5g65660 isoform X2 [Phoenix dactylifera]
MDAGEVTPPAHLSTRPTLGFPLGTALLLVVIFCLSGVFSCCYHWDKLRSLRRRHGRTSNPVQPADDHHHQHAPSSMPSPPAKLLSKLQNYKQEKDESLPVIMPGDRIPRFMAWPCPCEPSLATTERMVPPPSIPSHPPPSLVN